MDNALQLTDPPADTAAQTGRRDRNKAERRRRIKEAARAVFAEKGFDAATTREIASRAGIANGTLFLYAPDKVELLMMIVNDDLVPLTEAGLAALSPDRALLPQLMSFFAVRYDFWARDPRLSRSLVRETFNLDALTGAPGPETRRFLTVRGRIHARIAEVVRVMQAAGALRADAVPERAARMVCALYLTEVHDWLNQHRPDVADGLARLEGLLRLAVSGLARDADCNGAASGPLSPPTTREKKG